MSILLAALPLLLLMLFAYRGFSVIVAAPVLAMLAVALYNPCAVPAAFAGLFMARVADFVGLYFPVFLMGALFGKLIEISGFSNVIVAAVIRVAGPHRSMIAIVLVAALLTYGGVSVYVVVFAVYPFGAALFREAEIPKRLLPATIGLGAFTFTMDALPGTPQIQNIIPTSFFGTTTWAAPGLGAIASVLIFGTGMAYLEARRKQAARKGEGYGYILVNEPEPPVDGPLPPLALAVLPLLVVALTNLALTLLLPRLLGESQSMALPGLVHPIVIDVKKQSALWAVQGALLLGILATVIGGYHNIAARFNDGVRSAVGGALLAAMNTASEYGFGAVIAALPAFLTVRSALSRIDDPLLNEAVTITSLAGITGSASGGMSIALAALGEDFARAGDAAAIPREVLHRIASMASGGMDTLPHNGAIITLLAVTGLTHRQAYRDILALTGIKTATVFVTIAVYYATGIV